MRGGEGEGRKNRAGSTFQRCSPISIGGLSADPNRGTGGGEGRKGEAALTRGGMAMLLGEAEEEEEAVLMRWRRRQEGEGDISEEGEGRWMQGCQVLRGDIAIFSVAS